MSASSRLPCVLIADGTPASRTLLESPLRRAGWNVVTVTSSAEVLRAVRDHDVGVVLIDPDLPGVGVSGVDVVRALKNAPRLQQLPVFLLLRDGQETPAGVTAEGAFELDPASTGALLETIRGVTAPRAMARFGADEVRAVVDRIVREIAREVVPEVAARLIREEIHRLRREHGFEDPPA